MRFYSATVGAVFFMSGLPLAVSASPYWHVAQLTTGQCDDLYPQISGSSVIWQRQLYDGPYPHPQLFLYDGTTTRQLSNNSIGETTPANTSISGSHVVWDRLDDGSIGYFDGNRVTLLQAGSGYSYNYGPVVSGATAVWMSQKETGQARDVFMYDGAKIQQLTNGGTNTAPQVSGSSLVWRASEQGWRYQQVYLYDGVRTTQLTSSETEKSWLSISGSLVSWLEKDAASGSHLLMYDGQTTSQIAEGSSDAIVSPWMRDSSLVWRQFDGVNYEVFLYRDGHVQQLTDDLVNHTACSASGQYVVWRSEIDGKGEIFAYDGTTTTRLTSNDYDDYWVNISGSNIVWAGRSDDYYHIFTATLVPEPGTVLLLAFGALALLRSKR